MRTPGTKTGPRAFGLEQVPVLVHDQRTGEDKHTAMTVSSGQTQAVGLSSGEPVKLLCERQGYSVTETGKVDKLDVTLDLGMLAALRKGLDVTAGIKSLLQAFGVDDRKDREYHFTLWDDGNITLEHSDDGGGGTNLDFSKKGGDPVGGGEAD